MQLIYKIWTRPLWLKHLILYIAAVMRQPLICRYVDKAKALMREGAV